MTGFVAEVFAQRDALPFVVDEGEVERHLFVQPLIEADVPQNFGENGLRRQVTARLNASKTGLAR